MEGKVSLDKVYALSENVVAREVQGEFIIIPITSGIGDLEDEIFSLNETGRAVWDGLDGKRNLKDVAVLLSVAFEAPAVEIEKDVLGLSQELLKKKMLVEVKQD